MAQRSQVKNDVGLFKKQEGDPRAEVWQGSREVLAAEIEEPGRTCEAGFLDGGESC